MKFTRILALALASLCVLFVCASCGDVTAQTISVTVKIVADDPEEPILNTTFDLQSSNPTVLEAFIEACIVNEIDYNLTENEDSVLDIEEYVDYTDKETGIVYYWMYYINDVEPAAGSGKANVNAVADGDVITYTYTSFDPAEAK